MAIQLKKGQKIDLTKGNPGLKHIRLGLGWDTNMFDGGDDFDLDVSLFMVGKSGKVEQDEDFIFYNNLKHPSEAVEHLGDNRTGDGDGDDEEILVDFSKMPDRIEKIAVTVTIYEAKERRQNLRDICEIFSVASVPKNEIIDAINRDFFRDFEDCLQDKCAKEIGADYIITCNTKDFENSEVHAMNPKEFMDKIVGGTI